MRCRTPIGYLRRSARSSATASSLVSVVPGVALGARVVKDATLGGDRAALAARLGRELARIHEIARRSADLRLPRRTRRRRRPRRRAARRAGSAARRQAGRWNGGCAALELHAPRPADRADPQRLPHRQLHRRHDGPDRRSSTGNSPAWGDPHADLGWFCAQCWRFGAPAIGGRRHRRPRGFCRGYEAGGGRVDDARSATGRRSPIALGGDRVEQGDRHISGRQRSLELALTARIGAPASTVGPRVRPPPPPGDLRMRDRTSGAHPLEGGA